MSKVFFSKSFIDFLKKSDCKVANVLYRLHIKQKYISGWRSNLLTTEEINYITFRKDGTISYLPAGKEHKFNDNGDWQKDGRQEGRPSKVIRKLFTKRALKLFKDSDFECFTNSYKANFSDKEYTLKILPNVSIPSVYDMPILSGDGSLNNSCMNGDSNYLDIYKHCKQLSIAVLVNSNDELCGRSLIWKIDDNTTFMDRIYVVSDFMFEYFLDYAKDNGLCRKDSYKSYDNKRRIVMPDGSVIDKTFKIYTNTDHEYYPYIDTFSYGGDGYLTNSNVYEYEYCCTGGERDGGEDNHENEIYIENGERIYRNEWYHEDDCVLVGDDWYHKNDNNIVRVNGTWYTKDDSDIVEIDGDYHLLDDCIYCERDNEYYLSDDCVYCEKDEESILRDEAVEVDGIWYHEDSDKIFKVNGTYYTEDSEEIINIAGDWYEKDSTDICEVDGEYYLTSDEQVIEIDGEYQMRQLSIEL